VQPPLVGGRPNFPGLFADLKKSYPPKKNPVLTFACGPTPMVNELWDHSIALTGEGGRVDFHKEIFEF
jgi:hypothetical protein